MKDPPQPLRRTASTPPPQKPSFTTNKPPTTSSSLPNPVKLHFFYLITVIVTVISILTTYSLSSNQNPKTWFLSLPPSLHTHYSSSRSVNIHSFSTHSYNLFFTLQNTITKTFPHTTLVVHGLALSSYSFNTLLKSLSRKGIPAFAIDLPGSGFSDKTIVVQEDTSGGFFGPLWEVYAEIQEKGLFWGFDQLVEKGYVDQEEIASKGFKREVVKPIELGSKEMGRVLGQVIKALGLAPVDLVLHDSAFGLSANWVLENTDLVRSLTLVDTSSLGSSAFPLWVLEMPVVREVVLGFGFVFRKVVESCCSKGMNGSDLETHRALLKVRDGRKALVGMGRNRNGSFDLTEWGTSIETKGLPIQVIWANGWSKEWKEEGEKVANALPKAPFIAHSGGRWPQDDVADELAESISRFLSRLPMPVRQKEEEPSPKQIQKTFDKTKDNENPHHHHGHKHVHSTVHSTAYMNEAHGLGNAWAS